MPKKLGLPYYALGLFLGVLLVGVCYCISQLNCGGWQWLFGLGAIVGSAVMLGLYGLHHTMGEDVEVAYQAEQYDMQCKFERRITELEAEVGKSVFNLVSPKNDQKLTFIVPYLRTKHEGKASNISIGFRVGRGIVESAMQEICQLILGPADPATFTSKFPQYAGATTPGFCIRNTLMLTKLSHQTHSFIWQGRWIDVIAVEIFGAITGGSLDESKIITAMPGGTDLSAFLPLGELDQAMIDCTYFSPEVAKEKVSDPLSLLIIERLERKHRA